MLQIDVDMENGGLLVNLDFFADFGSELDSPTLAHEMRYPRDDCASTYGYDWDCCLWR